MGAKDNTNMGFKHVSFHARVDGYKPSTADVTEKKAVKVAPKTKAEPKALAFTQDGDPTAVEAQWQAAGRKSTIKSDPSADLASFGFVSKEGPPWQTSVTDPSKYPTKG